MARWTSWKHQARSRPSSLTVSVPASRSIYHPAVNLIVGCGARSAPVLLVASRSAPGASRPSAVPFYLLALALHAEILLAQGGGSQLETVRSAQAEVESAHPGAASAARQVQAVSVAAALARHPPGLAP
jgi:hypothetical protein